MRRIKKILHIPTKTNQDIIKEILKKSSSEEVYDTRFEAELRDRIEKFKHELNSELKQVEKRIKSLKERTKENNNYLRNENTNIIWTFEITELVTRNNILSVEKITVTNNLTNKLKEYLINFNPDDALRYIKPNISEQEKQDCLNNIICQPLIDSLEKYKILIMKCVPALEKTLTWSISNKNLESEKKEHQLLLLEEIFNHLDMCSLDDRMEMIYQTVLKLKPTNLITPSDPNIANQIKKKPQTTNHEKDSACNTNTIEPEMLDQLHAQMNSYLKEILNRSDLMEAHLSIIQERLKDEEITNIGTISAFIKLLHIFKKFFNELPRIEKICNEDFNLLKKIAADIGSILEPILDLSQNNLKNNFKEPLNNASLNENICKQLHSVISQYNYFVSHCGIQLAESINWSDDDKSNEFERKNKYFHLIKNAIIKVNIEDFINKMESLYQRNLELSAKIAKQNPVTFFQPTPAKKTEMPEKKLEETSQHGI